MLNLVLLATALLTAPPDDAITEISLQRTPCFGSCPVDEVVLRSDGSAEYTGTRFVKRLGKHKGKVKAKDFHELAELISEKKFFEMKDSYRLPITDQATLITGVTRGGKTKKVSDYGRAAPKGVQEVEKRVITLMEKIDWTAESDPPKGDSR